MNLQQLKQCLADNPQLQVRFGFSDGGAIEPHCHVTEIGKVTKDFVDCGGNRRKTEACVLQTFVANDIDHRIVAQTLSKIVAASKPLDLSADLSVEVEYESMDSNRGTIGLFDVAGFEKTETELVFQLHSKTTACLAPDQCGITPLTSISATLPSESVQPTDCGDSGC